ncbi:hypothetical protein E4T56_gene7611, partial [Termitomyces sp. T112]
QKGQETMICKRVLSAALAGAGLALASLPQGALAHHSFSMFDPSKPMKFEATVQNFQWTAPHAVLWVNAGAVDGYTPGLWALELPTSPANLAKMGWSRTVVKPGDKVVGEINPLRDGRRAAAAQMRRALLAAMLAASSLALSGAWPLKAQTPPADPITPAPSAKDWGALALLPDWSGSWFPVISDQVQQITTNPTPWKPEVQKQIDHWTAEEKAGRPRGLLVDCLPHGVPTFYLITHNSIEVLFTPGRVTILGESDGNRLLSRL